MDVPKPSDEEIKKFDKTTLTPTIPKDKTVLPTQKDIDEEKKEMKDTNGKK